MFWPLNAFNLGKTSTNSFEKWPFTPEVMPSMARQAVHNIELT